MIGTTNLPCGIAKDKAGKKVVKGFMDFFKKTLFVPRPDYSSLQLLWPALIEKNGGIVDRKLLEIDTLSQLSDGYTAGDVDAVCRRVLTEFRVNKIVRRPLRTVEFVMAMALVEPQFRVTYGMKKNKKTGEVELAMVKTPVMLSGPEMRKKLVELAEAEKGQFEAKGWRKPGLGMIPPLHRADVDMQIWTATLSHRKTAEMVQREEEAKAAKEAAKAAKEKK